MTKNKLLLVLVFLTITFVLTYYMNNLVVSITLSLMILINVLLLYKEEQFAKVVIRKKEFKKIFNKKNLSNYYVMFIELSNLNTYSQFYDITMSDDILKNVFKKLKKHFSSNQIFLYRTDQIVIIHEFINSPIINNELRYDEQYRNAVKVLHYLKKEKIIISNGQHFDINYNIGVAAHGTRKQETSMNDLIRLAHFSMIKSKEKMFDIIVANEELRVIKQDLDSFNQEIDSGFKLDEFSPFFLPIIDVKSMRVIGCESLVRWRKNTYRVIEASKFKEIAIERNLFEKIDKRVIEKTFANYQSWLENDLVDKDFSITINLSHKSIISLKPIELINLTGQYNINPANVEFDITDDSVLNEEGIDAISKIKEYGFKVSLDTFNNRCFSFQSLLNIELDTIKIDKSNLPNSEISEKQLNYYKSITTFSKAMDLKILSKGIENKHHLKIAQQLNVDYAQGYYFTPPLDDENIIIYLTKYRQGILTH